MHCAGNRARNNNLVRHDDAAHFRFEARDRASQSEQAEYKFANASPIAHHLCDGRQLNPPWKSLPPPDPSSDRVTFILGTPDVLVTNYMALEAAKPGVRAMPRGFILTSQDRGTAVVERVADDAYEIRNEAGENTGVFATVFVDKPFAVGDSWENDVMKAEVLTVGADGFPRSIRFRFADIRSARWVVWQGRGFVEVPLLELGEQRSFPSTPLLEAMQP